MRHHFKRTISVSTPTLYKIISMENWHNSKNNDFLAIEPIDKEFIHLATQEQLPHILKKYWHQSKEVMIIKLDPVQLKGKLIFEKNPGGSVKYYHLYEGSIPKASIIQADVAVL